MKLENIQKSIHIVCDTHEERQQVILFLMGEKVEYGCASLPLQEFHLFPSIWIDRVDKTWWECVLQGGHEDYDTIPASQFIASNTTEPYSTCESC